MTDFQTAADEYIKFGLNPIPLLGTEKRKLDGWKQYQSMSYDGNFSLANSLAIVCGKTSGYLCVVDIDVKNTNYSDKPFAALLHVFPDYITLQEKTWIVKTPSNGWHVYFKTTGVTFPTKKYKLDNGLEVEFRCQGAYVMAPPSPASTEAGYPKKHDEYTFFSKTDSIMEVEPSFFDDLKSMLGIDNTKPFTLANVWNGIDEGYRDDGTFALSMALLDQGNYNPDDVYDALCKVNKKHNPPMDDVQLKKIFDSSKNRMIRKGKTLGVKSMKKFDPQILVDDAIYGQTNSNIQSPEKKKTDTVLSWRSIVKLLKPYIHKIITSSTDNSEILCVVSDANDSNNIKKIIELGTINSQLWAIKNLVLLTKPSETFSDTQIDMAIKGITSVGSDLNVDTIYNRVAMRNNHIYIDMARPDWKIIKIGPDGYDIIPFDENCPVFVRFQHQGVMSEPIDYTGDPLEKFADLLRIKKSDKLIYKILQVAYFLEAYPIPIMLITGEHGSAKTTTEKGIINVVDPTNQNLTTIPNNNENLMLRLYTHYMVGFDNISEMSQQQSDVLCTAITGGGNEKRKLYTNKDMAILSFKRKIALNGIAPKIDFSDLRDRCIHIETEPIFKKMSEKNFYKLYNSLLPMVRKQVFELLSKAIKIYPEVEKEFEDSGKELPRMADFAVWGECISRSMGNNNFEFYYYYIQRVKDEKLELISEYPMVDFVDHNLLPSLNKTVSISLTGIINKLSEIYTKPDLHKNQLPETPRGIVPHLTKIATLLRVRNISYSVETETKATNGVCPRGTKYVIFERMDY